MNDFHDYRPKFDFYKVCIIIPTYNNETTLSQVINSVFEYTSNVLVVNDGSTDNSAIILKSFPALTVLNVSQNKGKGNALRLGFHKALEMGYKYSITIDSDAPATPRCARARGRRLA